MLHLSAWSRREDAAKHTEKRSPRISAETIFDAYARDSLFSFLLADTNNTYTNRSVRSSLRRAWKAQPSVAIVAPRSSSRRTSRRQSSGMSAHCTMSTLTKARGTLR